MLKYRYSIYLKSFCYFKSVTIGEEAANSIG